MLIVLIALVLIAASADADDAWYVGVVMSVGEAVVNRCCDW